MMKILYIITQADGGGAQKYALALAKHFKGAIAAGHSTPRQTLRSDSRRDEARKLFDDAKSAGLNVYPLKHLKRNINLWHDILAIWEIRELIKLIKPDIVHLNSTKAGILGSFASIGIKSKIVFTAHGFRFLEPLPYSLKMFYLALERIASDFRDFIITVSEADRQAALKNQLINANKIQTIHNGIEKIVFLTRENARQELGLPMDKKIFVTLANDYKTKGLDIYKTLEPIPGTIIAIIGQTSNQKNSNEFIKYLGFIPDASKYLKAFDGAIIPSKKEGFPFAILEAMQAGQPIISTDVGGIPEALGDAGILIPQDNPQKLAQAIKKISNDINLKTSLAQKALARSTLFTQDKMLEETAKIYRKILG